MGDNREVESAGLSMCFELVSNMAETDQQTCNTFFQTFFTTILQDVFFVVTDSDHKAGFKSQSMLLAKMFWLVDSDRHTEPRVPAKLCRQPVSDCLPQPPDCPNRIVH